MTIFGLIVVGFTLNGEGPVSDTQGLVFVLAQGPTAQIYFWDFADVILEHFFSIYVLEALAQARVSFARELPSNDCPNLNSFSGFH